jgi:hypothetical protein
MDTREFQKCLIVEDDDHLNEILKPGGLVETGVDNLQVDYAVDGVISGLVVTERGTPDMTVDVSAGVAYDGEGKRCKVSSGQIVDISGVTLPGGGNEKWVSIFIENLVVTAEPWIDDDGVSGYWEHNDSFLLTIVEGAEAAPPAARASVGLAKKRLLADVKLVNGQTTILNADIDTSRRETSTWPGDRSGIDASGWTALSTASINAQEALDDVDAKIIAKDGSGEIGENLVPDGDGTRDLGSASKGWDVHIKEVKTSLIPDGTTREVGPQANPWGKMHSLEMHAAGATNTGRLFVEDAAGAGFQITRIVSIEHAKKNQNYPPTAEPPWNWINQYNLGGAADMWVNKQALGDDLNNYLHQALALPDGSVLDQIDAEVYQSATAGTNEMYMEVYKATMAGARTIIGSQQAVTYRYYVLFKGARDAASTIDSALIGIRETFTYKDVGRCPGW